MKNSKEDLIESVYSIIKKSRKNAAAMTVVFAILFVATSLSVVSNNNHTTIQSARAQGPTTTHDTFHVKGMIDSMASDVLAGRPVSPLNQSAMWILGGNWNLNKQSN
jgi:hypothetical protein